MYRNILRLSAVIMYFCNPLRQTWCGMIQERCINENLVELKMATILFCFGYKNWYSIMLLWYSCWRWWALMIFSSKFNSYICGIKSSEWIRTLLFIYILFVLMFFFFFFCFVLFFIVLFCFNLFIFFFHFHTLRKIKHMSATVESMWLIPKEPMSMINVSWYCLLCDIYSP